MSGISIFAIINTKIVSPYSLAELKKLLQDFNLVMEDGSWSHFEFQSRNEGLEGLKRFRAYEAVTSYQYKVKITTYVLFSGQIQNPMMEFTEGLNTYRVQPIIMTKYNVHRVRIIPLRILRFLRNRRKSLRIRRRHRDRFAVMV